MEDKVKAIIQNVRDIYKYDLEKKEIVNNKARIEFTETEDGNIQLHSITFNWYSSYIYVYDTGIVYSPDYGNARKVLEYKNWDELINI